MNFELPFQVPEDPLFALLFTPIPIIFTIGSVLWLIITYKGAERGGYPIYVEDIQKDSRWMIDGLNEATNAAVQNKVDIM